MADIANGTPRAYLSGISDNSRRTVPNEPESIPTHLAKVYIFAKTGPTTPQLVGANTRTSMYGVESFDEQGAWTTHTTILSNILNSKGNAQMIQRLKPADAGPNSSMRLCLDLLETDVPDYQRNSDGSITRDVDGLPVPTGAMVPGFKGKWIVRQVPLDTYGLATQSPGVQTDGARQSVSYPFFDLEVPHFGSNGNNSGLRIWSQSTKGESTVDQRLLTESGVYPFRMAVVRRKDELTTGKLHYSMFGESSVQVALKPESMDRTTEKALYVGEEFIKAYQDMDHASGIPVWGPFGKMYVYNDSVAQVLAALWTAEKDFVTEFSDIEGIDVNAEKWLMNVFGAHSSEGVPYTTFQLDTSGADVVRMSENAVFYARGGSDGTMNENILSELVAEEVLEYSNPDSPLQDMVMYPESIMYDSGFALAAKKAMTAFISLRKDTALVLCTHDTQGRILTASEESSLAITLRTMLQLYPESIVHGTSVCRAMVVGRSGRLLGSKYRRTLPLSLEIAAKAADYMGASNGIWKAGMSFASAPRNEVKMFTDINVTFTPDSVRNKDWAMGLVWVQSFTRKTAFFPALKTVYDDDTSVLNSFFTMMVCVELEKVGFNSWKQFTGTDHLTNPELKRQVEQFISDNVKDRFDGRVVIIPEVYFTAADLARGYSWSTRIKMYAANMKTANAIELQANRLDDLAV